MSKDVTLSQEEDPAESDLEILRQGLTAYNRNRAGVSGYEKLIIFLRDNTQIVVGGVLGETSRGWLYVELLYVSESFRGQGYGSELLKRAECEALRRGCQNVYLDTFGFQAPEFYRAHGYRVFGELPNFPTGHTRYFLTKRIGELVA